MADTFTPVYDIVEGVSQTLSPTYGIKQHVSGTLSPVYNLRVSVSQTLSPGYDIFSGVAVSQTLTALYDVHVNVSKTLSPSYSMVEQISQTLSPTYLIYENVSQTLTALYDVIQHVSQTLEPEYDVAECVSQTLSPVYNIAQTQVAQTLSPTYNIAELVAVTLSPAYNVRESVSQTISATYNLGYGLGAESTDDNDVILTIYCPGCPYGHPEHDPYEMCFSEDDVTYGDWEAYATTRDYQLSPQTSYPTQAKTVYVKFRRPDDEELTTVSDSIDLEVAWTDTGFVEQDGRTSTYGTPFNLLYRATSSADDDGYPDHYRLRVDSGDWGGWTEPTWTVVDHGLGIWWHKIPDFDLTEYGYGAHLIELEARDDDLNVIDSPLSLTLSYIMEEEDQYSEPVIVSKFGLRRRHRQDVRIVRGDIRRVNRQGRTP